MASKDHMIEFACGLPSANLQECQVNADVSYRMDSAVVAGRGAARTRDDNATATTSRIDASCKLAPLAMS